MERRFMLVDWFFGALEKRDDEDLIYGARSYANELRKYDPRVARELDAAIDRHEREKEESGS